MLFASSKLAARIERAEVDLLMSATEAVRRGRPEGDALVRPIAGGAALYASEGSPLNKVAGLGFDGPLDEEELAAIEHEYAVRDAPVHVELSCLADPSVAPMLTARGYRLVGFENVLGRDLTEDVSPPESGTAADLGTGTSVHPGDTSMITVDPATAYEEWLDTVVTGFVSPDLAIRDRAGVTVAPPAKEVEDSTHARLLEQLRATLARLRQAGMTPAELSGLVRLEVLALGTGEGTEQTDE